MALRKNRSSKSWSRIKFEVTEIYDEFINANIERNTLHLFKTNKKYFTDIKRLNKIILIDNETKLVSTTLFSYSAFYKYIRIYNNLSDIEISKSAKHILFSALFCSLNQEERIYFHYYCCTGKKEFIKDIFIFKDISKYILNEFISVVYSDRMCVNICIIGYLFMNYLVD
ncbi:hypothetical protein H312_02990 [Anncaliia algerae PRA339]|uniref:Uncharacterized protein n=1 Tax=Anncaliia algerae PRA339 TaxID=1288291 RepID=A0A059EXP0_9MICR|nr:hypothetical protein H312_02990 [Anncaliia algerae PRA339]